MRLSTGALLCAIVLGLGVPMAAGADQRPAVTVRFALVDSQYRLKFANVPGVEAAAAARLAERLGSRIGFARFTDQGGPDTVLTFALNRQDPAGTAPMREVGFHVTLQRQGLPVGDGEYVIFRPQTESGAPLPGRDALLDAIGAKVAGAAGPRGPITLLLSKLPIARSAVLQTNPVGWVIPYRHQDLCMSTRSIVHVSNTIQLPTVGVEHTFRAKTSGWLMDGTRKGQIVGMPDPDSQAHLEELKNARVEQVTVGDVHIIEYAPNDPCDAVVPPAPR